MTELRKAAEMALDYIRREGWTSPQGKEVWLALCQALAQPEQEPLGSEWVPCVKLPVIVHVRNQRDGETYIGTREGITPVLPDDLIMRGLAGEQYPIGRELFERTYTFEVDTVNMSQERVDETEKREHEPVAWFIQYEYRHEFLWRKPNELEQKTALEIKPLYTAPPKREWVGIDEKEVAWLWFWMGNREKINGYEFAKAIEAKLKERNGG